MRFFLISDNSDAMNGLRLAGIEGTVARSEADLRQALENAAKQAMLLYNEPIDYLICGHKHREQEYVSGYTDQGNSVVVRVPSICGMDEYAQRLGYGGKPGALGMVLESGYGRRCIYPIVLR